MEYNNTYLLKLTKEFRDTVSEYMISAKQDRHKITNIINKIKYEIIFFKVKSMLKKTLFIVDVIEETIDNIDKEECEKLCDMIKYYIYQCRMYI